MLRSRLTCTVTAADDQQLLTTVDRAKMLMTEADSFDNDQLVEYLAQASEAVLHYLGWPVAVGESQPLAIQSYKQDFIGTNNNTIWLGRLMLREITSITSDDVAVALNDLWINYATGNIVRKDCGMFGDQVSVEYSAGFYLPPHEDRDLPRAFEAATIQLLRHNRLEVGDSTIQAPVKSESYPGAGAWTYETGSYATSTTSMGVPVSVANALARYRRPVLV